MVENLPGGQSFARETPFLLALHRRADPLFDGWALFKFLASAGHQGGATSGEHA